MLAFIYAMNDGVETAFREQITQWIDWDINQVNHMNGINEIVNIIAENVPAVYQNIKRIIQNEKD